MSGRVQLPVAGLAALFELRVTDGEDLVEDEDVAHRPERHRVGKPRRHAARVVAQFEMGKPFEPGKLEDRGGRLPQLAKGQAHDRAEQFDVVDRVEVGIPSDAEFEDRRHRGADVHPAGVGLVDPGHDLQQGALPAPVASHQAEAFAAPQLEADVVEHLQPLFRPRAEQVERMLADGLAAARRNHEALGDAGDLDRARHVRVPRQRAARGAV